MLSKELEFTLGQAFQRAREQRHEYMTVEHLLLCLLDNPSASKVLRACGADEGRLRSDISLFVAETTPLIPTGDKRETQPTIGFQRVLQRAVFHVQSAGKKEVMGANVLVALFGEQDSQAVFLLNQQDISRMDVVNFISHGISKVPGEGQDEEADASEERVGGGKESASPLESFTSNLNELARQGRIDPLIGRQAEVERTIQTLCRRRKNNPLLVGEAGVGKTAIAEGLARRIVEEEVPEILADAVIYALDLGALVAGGHAGLVYTDWPLMNGSVLPPADWSLGAVAFLHDQCRHDTGGLEGEDIGAVRLHPPDRPDLAEKLGRGRGTHAHRGWPLRRPFRRGVGTAAGGQAETQGNSRE
jgi:ATP-dependent Clp protease ATP-binding subunit ClpA